MKPFLFWFFWWLSDHTEWWPWLSSWLMTWSIELDSETMANIREAQEEIARGGGHKWVSPRRR